MRCLRTASQGGLDERGDQATCVVVRVGRAGGMARGIIQGVGVGPATLPHIDFVPAIGAPAFVRGIFLTALPLSGFPSAAALQRPAGKAYDGGPWCG